MVNLSPTKISGQIQIPASKSVSQRALAIALVTQGNTIIHGFGHSNDEIAALDLIKNLGANILQSEHSLTILSDGKINPRLNTLNCNESGLSFRMFLPIAGLCDQSITFTGTGTLLNRIHSFPEAAFQKLHVSLIQNDDNRLPVIIKGPINPRSISIHADQSSQYLTGLLIALAASTEEIIKVEVTDLVSRPYVNLTINMLQQFGYLVNWLDEVKIQIQPRPIKNFEERTIQIESDWSSASFWIVGAALSGSVKLSGLNPDSYQADRVILSVLDQARISYHWDNEFLCIEHSDSFQAFDIDANDCPDLIPILSILAARAQGTSRIKGIDRLINKESNREETGLSLLHLLGVKVITSNNEWLIEGSGDLFRGGAFDSMNDHRMVMTAAIASTCCKERLTIMKSDAVNKSYPDFFNHFQKVGGVINP
jgi:3-phosphoshikimate 1-carboxyvinyltransferase